MTERLRPDLAVGRAHAHARHTPEGLWEAGRVLSAGDPVSVFASEVAFERAVRGIPLERSAWRGLGRLWTERAGVRYLGHRRGDTLRLETLFPLDRHVTRAAIERALAEAQSGDAFAALLLRAQP